jgi:STE24 endopeptidase
VITDYLLDEMTPAEIDAVLAHELGHSRNQDNLPRLLLGNAALTGPGLLLVGLEKHGPLAYMACVYVLCLAVIVGFRRLYGSLAIRWELKGDDVAARIAGRAVLAAALAHLTELNAIKRDTSRSWDRAVGHPGMAERIVRLQTAAPSVAPD